MGWCRLPCSPKQENCTENQRKEVISLKLLFFVLPVVLIAGLLISVASDDSCLRWVLPGKNVSITADGKTLHVSVKDKTVKEVLDRQKINLGAKDIVTPALNTPIKNGLDIKVTRVTASIVNREIKLPYGTRNQPDPNLYINQVQEASAGQEGLERETWEISYLDGKESGRRLIDSQVLAQPQDRVYLVGTLDTVSRGGQVVRFNKVLKLLATGYTHTGNVTASGQMPEPGVVAVDTRVIPMGTRLYVEGYGFATALDKGGAIKGNRIDLFFNSEQEAGGWGTRWVKVYVLD